MPSVFIRPPILDLEDYRRVLSALPYWMRVEPYLLNDLWCRLGTARTLRLAELIGDAGGLNPTEARPWFEPLDQPWHEIEQALFAIFEAREQRGRDLPWHIARWTARHRDANPEVLTSLFD